MSEEEVVRMHETYRLVFLSERCETPSLFASEVLCGLNVLR